MGLFPKNLNEYVASLGIPRGPLSKAYFVDPVNGSDSNPGTTWQAPLLSIEAAYALCTGDRHDTVLFLAGDTANNPAAAITWAKDYTHLIGVGCDLPGLGQRCRVVTTAAVGVSPVITFSASGCIVKNMQFNQEKATGTASGVAVVTGLRNYFENVFFMAPTSATAASYSLKVSGSENVFKRCTVGQYTNFRSEASYGLWLFGAATCLRNKFIECEFLSWQGGAGSPHAHVYVDAAVAVVPWVIWFEDCFFGCNYSGGTIQTQAIDDNSTSAGHQIILRGQNDFLGCSAVADTLTYIFAHDPEDTVSGCLMIAVAEA